MPSTSNDCVWDLDQNKPAEWSLRRLPSRSLYWSVFLHHIWTLTLAVHFIDNKSSCYFTPKSLINKVWNKISMKIPVWQHILKVFKSVSTSLSVKMCRSVDSLQSTVWVLRSLWSWTSCGMLVLRRRIHTVHDSARCSRNSCGLIWGQL